MLDKGAYSIYAQYAHAYLSSYCNCPVYCESCAESFFQGQLRRMPRPALVSFPGEGLCGTWERDQLGTARPQPMHARPAGRAHIILYHGIEHVVYLPRSFVSLHQLRCLQLPARPGIVTAMSLLRYIKVISKPSDASSSSGSHAEGSSTNHDGQCHGARDDDSAEDSGPSPLKRAKTVSHTLDSKLSASEVDAILTSEVPDLGLFPIVKVRNSAATHDRLKEKLLKSRFVPSKSWVAPKRQCGQKKRVFQMIFSTKNCTHVFVTVLPKMHCTA